MATNFWIVNLLSFAFLSSVFSSFRNSEISSREFSGVTKRKNTVSLKITLKCRQNRFHCNNLEEARIPSQRRSAPFSPWLATPVSGWWGRFKNVQVHLWKDSGILGQKSMGIDLTLIVLSCREYLEDIDSVYFRIQSRSRDRWTGIGFSAKLDHMVRYVQNSWHHTCLEVAIIRRHFSLI